MILEYFREYTEYMPYYVCGPGLIKKFEEYIEENQLDLQKAYIKINDFTDTLPITRKTRRSYRQVLRRFLEYVINKKKEE